MSTCNTCVHWDKKFLDDIPDLYDPYRHQEPTGKQWGNCKLAMSSQGEPVADASKAVALDYEEYIAYLRSREDFGCVQHKPKEGKAPTA